MTNLVVHRETGGLPRMSNEMEPFHYTHWDPYHQMTPYLAGQVASGHFSPDFEIRETRDGFVFKADLPGIRDKDLEITLSGNRLTISGHRESEKEERSDIYYARECSYGGFTRAFTLPEGADGSKQIRAELEKGVLTVYVPKKPAHHHKRIEVKVTDKPKT